MITLSFLINFTSFSPPQSNYTFFYLSSSFTGCNRWSLVLFPFAFCRRTMACPRGRSTTITFRCRLISSIPAEQQTDVNNIRAPDKCPDATCDGCNFHFIWETPFACHLCNEKELTYSYLLILQSFLPVLLPLAIQLLKYFFFNCRIVKGECKDGVQDIHYLASPDSQCLLSINATWPKTHKCQNHLPFFVEVINQSSYFNSG